MTDDPLTALRNVVSRLDQFCDNWTLDGYDPRVILRQIADEARASIPGDKHGAIVVLNDLHDQIDSVHYNVLLRALESIPD